MSDYPELPEPIRKQGQQIASNGDCTVFFDCYDNTQMRAYVDADRAMRANDAKDAARYRLLRQFHLASGSWPHQHIPAPAGLIAWSARIEEPGAMTTDVLDKVLDDMLGLLPMANVRADYQEWRATKTAASVRLARAKPPKA